jgi:5-methylcytosine-specific restriction endonuclease McrA
MTHRQRQKLQAKTRREKARQKRLAQKQREHDRVQKRKEKRRIKSAPKRALVDWSREARKHGSCAICGDIKGLQAHHLLPKERYKTLRLEPMNALVLCWDCHKFSKYSAHRNPIWFSEWLRKNRPRQFQWVIDHMDDK